MLSVVLIDDEDLAIKELEYLIGNLEGVKVIGKYTDPVKALAELAQLTPDIIFLDIDMPGLDGMTMAEHIKGMNFDSSLVFATVSPEHALKAFELEAVDYIKKPFSEDRLRLTIDRINKRKKASINKPEETEYPEFENKIAVRYNEQIVLLKTDDIIYCSTENKKTLVKTRENTYESGLSLTKLTENLQERGFFRCHKSFLVNLDYVKNICPHFKYTGVIKLKIMDMDIPVSRTKMKVLKKLLSL